MSSIDCFNVRDFGAVGDGTARDTAAIQKAIDACHGGGGGRVIVPAGRYLSGTLLLKSHVELHLRAGAVIVASERREDYNAENLFPENQAFAQESVTATHLIIAYRQENVSITGHGVIDGSGGKFFGPLPPEATATYRYKSHDFPITSWRPGQMVFFCRCEDVRVHDVRLINAPYWTLFLLGCRDAHISGLRIDNPPATRNGDGIDIDCCRNVTISDCIIRSGDDCITVRANESPLGHGDFPCENIVVSNCVLSTPCNAIRVGVGDGGIRRCSFSNIVVPEASRAISIISRYGNMGRHGASIEQIQFSDFIIDACFPLSIHVGPHARPPASIGDVSFNRFRITASAGSHLVGLEHAPLHRVTINDFDWLIRGGSENLALVEGIPESFPQHGYTGVNNTPALPCAIYARHLQDAVFQDIRIRWDNPSSLWRQDLRVEKSERVVARNVDGPPPRAA